MAERSVGAVAGVREAAAAAELMAEVAPEEAAAVEVVSTPLAIQATKGHTACDGMAAH